MVNIILSVIFAIILFIAGVSIILGFGASILLRICVQSIIVNLFLAAFNLLPFPPLDGASVLAWNKLVWAVIEVPLLLMMLSLMFMF